MNRASTFLSLSWLSYRGLFMWLTPWTFLSGVVLAPFLNYLVFAFLTFNGTPAATRQNILLNFPVVSIAAVVLGCILQMFYYERVYEIGRVPQGFNFRLLFAKAFLHIPSGILGLLIPFLISLSWLDISMSSVNWPIWLLSAVAICLGYCAFSLLLGVFVSAIQEWLTSLSLGGVVFHLLTGAVIPLEALPSALRFISAGIPVTHGLIAYRISILGGPVNIAIREIGLEFAISVAYALAACAAWALLSHLRRSGRL